MVASFILTILPLSVLGLAGLSLIAELFWRVFARSNSKDESANVSDALAALRISGQILLVYGTLVLSAMPPLVSIIQSNQTSAALIVLALVSFLASNIYKTPDMVVFVIISSYATIYLLNGSDIITIFFVLELLNNLVLYSFFFTVSFAGANRESAAYRITMSCVYQFTLNFFSSVALYVSIILYIMATGGSQLTHAYLWQVSPLASISIGVFVSAFLLKFGTGPWIFFKINIYRNMNFQLLLLYSAVYITVIFILFLNLIFILGITFGQLVVAFITSVIIAASTIFGSAAFQTPNIFIFVSFSSLMNLSVFVIQAITA